MQRCANHMSDSAGDVDLPPLNEVSNTHQLLFFFSFKAEGIVYATPENCFKVCDPKPESSRAHWDTSIKSLEMVQMIQGIGWPVCKTCVHVNVCTRKCAFPQS